MQEIHEIFKKFKNEFSSIHEANESLGKVIHEQAGIIPDKFRWLLKIAISGASGHSLALETHIAKAKEAGATDAEIVQTLLLLIQTTGFPTFMEAYSVFKNMC